MKKGGETNPYANKLPQVIFQRAESAPLSGGQSISSLGEGGHLLGGGGNPRFPTLCMKPVL